MNTNSPVIPISNLNSNEVQKQLSIPFSYTNEDPILSEFQLMFNNGHVTKMTAQIKVSDLMVDFDYQRHPGNTKINKIVKNFDPDLLGVIICSMRENGQVAIIDGSHRYHALVQMNQMNLNINALVYFGLSLTALKSICPKAGFWGVLVFSLL